MSCNLHNDQRGRYYYCDHCCFTGALKGKLRSQESHIKKGAEWIQPRLAGSQDTCHSFSWGLSESSPGEIPGCDELPGVLHHPMIGSRLLPPGQSTGFPGAAAFLLPSSAQGTLGPGTLELHGCYCAEAQVPTCLAWHDPQPGSLGSPAAWMCQRSRRTLQVTSPPPLHSRVQLPRLLQVACGRPAAGVRTLQSL